MFWREELPVLWVLAKMIWLWALQSLVGLVGLFGLLGLVGIVGLVGLVGLIPDSPLVLEDQSHPGCCWKKPLRKSGLIWPIYATQARQNNKIKTKYWIT